MGFIEFPLAFEYKRVIMNIIIVLVHSVFHVLYWARSNLNERPDDLICGYQNYPKGSDNKIHSLFNHFVNYNNVQRWKMLLKRIYSCKSFCIMLKSVINCLLLSH